MHPHHRHPARQFIVLGYAVSLNHSSDAHPRGIDDKNGKRATIVAAIDALTLAMQLNAVSSVIHSDFKSLGQRLDRGKCLTTKNLDSHLDTIISSKRIHRNGVQMQHHDIAAQLWRYLTATITQHTLANRHSSHTTNDHMHPPYSANPKCSSSRIPVFAAAAAHITHS